LPEDHHITVHEIRNRDFEHEVEKFRQFPQKRIQPPDYTFALDASEEESLLLTKIEVGCLRIGHFGGTYFGIQTYGRDKHVSRISGGKYCRPVIDGGSVFRYWIAPPVDYLDYRARNIKSGGDPNIYRKERIVVRQIGQYPEGAICPEGLLTLNTIYNIYLKSDSFDLRYILALINSKLLRFFWTKRFFDNKETFPKIKKQPLESIPIKNVSLREQMPLIELVNRVVATKKRDPKADTTELEQEIDRLVFELYDLTPEEIAVVEESTSAE
jgi:hypothetical protein